MPTRETAPVGAPCWIDLLTSDTERSRDFYCRLFGWEAEEPAAEFGGYFNFTKDGARVAGCMGNQAGSGIPDFWSVYLASDDAAKTVGAATANGGEVHAQPMAVGDLGTMAYVGDPDGAGIGVWQPGRHHGFGIFGEPGTPSWFELHARDYRAAVDFYRNVFRWDTHVVSDTPEFRYSTMRHGEDWLAGIMDASGFLTEEVSAHWSVYFGVDDTDAALARIVELGGSVLMDAEDTPYGRLAAAADPTGAQFKLVAANDAMPGSSASA
ncbi:MAG: VOC family protein [Propionibacteriales bacterium]|nr:VOC family protein [Propionibacteriales bacterium]